MLVVLGLIDVVMISNLLIMVIIGVMVGGMVIAMYLPIFKLAATI